MHKLSNCITWIENKLSDWGSTIDGHVRMYIYVCVCNRVQLLHYTFFGKFTFVLFKGLTSESKLSWHSIRENRRVCVWLHFMCFVVLLFHFVEDGRHCILQFTHTKYILCFGILACMQQCVPISNWDIHCAHSFIWGEINGLNEWAK